MEFEEAPLLQQLTGTEFRDAMKLADGHGLPAGYEEEVSQ